MRAALIAILVIIAFVGGRHIIAAADKAQHKQDAIHDALNDLSDCRKDVYEKTAYDSIRPHLPSPENKFEPTTVQLVDSTLPTPGERKLLADYQTDVLACKTAAADKIRQADPDMAPELSADMTKSNDIMDRLMAGKIAWGEAAHLGAELRHK